AGREFGIMEKMIRDWRKTNETLEEMAKMKCANCGNMQSFVALEVDLNEWVLQSQQNGYIVTRNAIRSWALKMAKEEKYKTDGSSTFAASAGWCTCFMGSLSECIRKMKDAWESIPDQMIHCSFLKCGINNAMDGSQDAAMYEISEEDDEADDVDSCDNLDQKEFET
uniref:HTH CENPB-type domain-containing protein n=1 Tax=Latimeria chalumnae TaxID=7897 RepID=H3B3M9_LATCH